MSVSTGNLTGGQNEVNGAAAGGTSSNLNAQSSINPTITTEQGGTTLSVLGTNLESSSTNNSSVGSGASELTLGAGASTGAITETTSTVENITQTFPGVASAQDNQGVTPNVMQSQGSQDPTPFILAGIGFLALIWLMRKN